MSSLSNNELFNKLMERLSINIVPMSEVSKSIDLRIEAEFYNAKRTSFKSVKGSEIETFSQYGTSKSLNEDGYGYPILRLNEFDSFFIHTPSKYCNIIDSDTYEALKLKKNDVLICRTNGNPKYVGKAALVPQDYDYAFASYLYRIRTNKDLITPATLVAYLNSSFGRLEIERFAMVGNQANFSPAKFRQIEIPIFGSSFQKLIADIVELAFAKLNDSRNIFEEACKLLTSELNFDTWSFSYHQMSVRTFQHILKAGRIDAEYYQPKYDDMITKIKAFGGGTVETECTLYEGNYIPENNLEYKYIELANIGNYGEIKSCTYNLGSELPTRARRIVHSGNIIISSVEGSLQSCALIPKDYDEALCSTGFFVLDSEKINSETLLVLFKSEPIQALLKQQCTGTILAAFNKDSLLSIPIPEINKVLQRKIKKYITNSFELRQYSLKLLEATKRAVEIAIEENEESAIIHLNSVK